MTPGGAVSLCWRWAQCCCVGCCCICCFQWPKRVHVADGDAPSVAAATSAPSPRWHCASSVLLAHKFPLLRMLTLLPSAFHVPLIPPPVPAPLPALPLQSPSCSPSWSSTACCPPPQCPAAPLRPAGLALALVQAPLKAVTSSASVVQQGCACGCSAVCDAAAC